MSKGKGNTPTDTALMERPTVTDAMAVAPGVNPADTRGKEHIDRDDLILPRVAIAQKTSPQLDPSKSEYIEGLRLFQMFNSLSGENLGNGPIEFAVLGLQKKAMQFDADSNVLDFDVPWDDPRCQFTAGPNGERVKPQATRFYEFLVVLLPSLELAVLSLKTTQIKVAQTLSTYLQLRSGPSWAGRFTLSSTSKTKGVYTHGQYLVKPAGPTPAESLVEIERLYQTIAGRRVVADPRETGDDEPTAPTVDAEAVPF